MSRYISRIPHCLTLWFVLPSIYLQELLLVKTWAITQLVCFVSLYHFRTGAKNLPVLAEVEILAVVFYGQILQWVLSLRAHIHGSDALFPAKAFFYRMKVMIGTNMHAKLLHILLRAFVTHWQILSKSPIEIINNKHRSIHSFHNL